MSSSSATQQASRRRRRGRSNFQVPPSVDPGASHITVIDN